MNLKRMKNIEYVDYFVKDCCTTKKFYFTALLIFSFAQKYKNYLELVKVKCGEANFSN